VEVVALLALDAVAVGEFAVVEAAVEKVQGVIAVFLVEGKLVALKLCVVLPHIIAELAVDVDAVAAGEVRNLDIEVLALAEEHPEVDLAFAEDPACAAEDHVGAVGEVGHYEGCR
jgi:hypothetical protein